MPEEIAKYIDDTTTNFSEMNEIQINEFVESNGKKTKVKKDIDILPSAKEAFNRKPYFMCY